MTAELVLYEMRPPAVVLTLNRPDRRNALSRSLIAALSDAFAGPRPTPPSAASSSPAPGRPFAPAWIWRSCRSL